MRRILLVGCGYLGGAWLRQARQAFGTRAEIWALARTPRPLGEGVRGLWGDLHDGDLASRLPAEPLDAVISCAAADQRDPDGYRALYVEATRKLVEALGGLAQPPGRLIWTSSTGIYGHDGGEWVDEKTTPGPRGWRGEIMLEAEAVVAAAPFSTTCLRLAGIYGPRRLQLAARLRAGWDPGAGGRRFTNRIHLADCVGVINHLLRSPAPPAVLLAADSEPATLAEVAAVLRGAGRGGQAPAPPSWNQSMTPGVGGGGVAGRGLGKRCSNALLLSLGYHLQLPTFREGYAAGAV